MSSRPPASAKRNFAFTAAFTAVNILSPLITFAYVSRILGPTLTGRINMATALASYFALMAASALPIYGAREIARVRNDPERLRRVFSELIALNLAFTGIAIVLYGSCLLLPGRIRSEWPLYAAAGLLVLANCVSMDWFFQGLEEFPSVLARNLSTKIVAFLLIVLLVRRGQDYIYVVVIGAAAAAAYNLWGLGSALRKVSLRFRDIHPLSHLRPLALLGVVWLLTNAYVYLDGVLLGFLAGEHALGLYSAAIRVTRTSYIVVFALTMAILPRITAFLESGRREDYAALGQKSIRTVFFICFPIYGILTALAPRIVGVLAGPEFLAAGATLRYTLPLLPLAGFTNWLGLQILFPRGDERALLFSSATGAAVNLALNLILIPRFAENGAAWSAVATEACAGLVLLAFARKRPSEFRYWDAHATLYLALGVLAGGVAWAVSYRVGRDVAAAFAGGLAGTAFYLGALWLGKDPLAREMTGMAGRRWKAALGSTVPPPGGV
ncbi:MAG: flippase [Fibrobacteres bacterium]|nr:flippase [Fibrobacterota bacterium]